MGVVHIINGLTTRSPAIMAELRLLWRVLDLNGINLLTEYINTKENVQADALSRLDDEEDWQLNPKVFRMIDAVEQHSVDRFATALNALLPRFNSRWEQPGAKAVNSLALSDEHWRSEKNWCKCAIRRGVCCQHWRTSWSSRAPKLPSWHRIGRGRTGQRSSTP